MSNNPKMPSLNLSKKEEKMVKATNKMLKKLEEKAARDKAKVEESGSTAKVEESGSKATEINIDTFLKANNISRKKFKQFVKIILNFQDKAYKLSVKTLTNLKFWLNKMDFGYITVESGYIDTLTVKDTLAVKLIFSPRGKEIFNYVKKTYGEERFINRGLWQEGFSLESVVPYLKDRNIRFRDTGLKVNKSKE